MIGYDSCIASCKAQLKKLQTDYLDLYLIHWPYQDWEGKTNDPKRRKDSWRAMMDLQKQGLVKSIGVSNYLKPHLEEIFAGWFLCVVDSKIHIFSLLTLFQIRIMSSQLSTRLKPTQCSWMLNYKSTVQAKELCLKHILHFVEAVYCMLIQLKTLQRSTIIRLLKFWLNGVFKGKWVCCFQFICVQHKNIIIWTFLLIILFWNYSKSHSTNSKKCNTQKDNRKCKCVWLLAFRWRNGQLNCIKWESSWMLGS